ncbi:MAG: SGNH/GDSL hydrolase family protein, partial [Planctomycetes bacterium]|nr:SGNH/GDSL hydrolase family protein [Planctomycetota bacterium]
LLILLPILLGVYRRYGIWWTPPWGTGPAGPGVSVEPFRRAWREGPVLLFGLGDSITRGFGGIEHEGRERGYLDLVAHNLDAHYPDMRGKDLAAVLPGMRILNHACDFTISKEHLRWLRAMPAQAPDVFGIVCVSTGGNDLIHFYGREPPTADGMYGATLGQARPWIEGFRQRLDDILDAVGEKFPGGCEIFLLNIYDPTDGVGDIENANVPLPAWPDGLKLLDAYNRILREAADARRNVRLVDLHGLFLGHGIHCRDRDHPHYDAKDPHYWYTWILEDPNARGHDALRRLVLLKMIEVLAPDDG